MKKKWGKDLRQAVTWSVFKGHRMVWSYSWYSTASYFLETFSIFHIYTAIVVNRLEDSTLWTRSNIYKIGTQSQPKAERLFYYFTHLCVCVCICVNKCRYTYNYTYIILYTYLHIESNTWRNAHRKSGATEDEDGNPWVRVLPGC